MVAVAMLAAVLSPVAGSPTPAAGQAQTTIVVNSTLDLSNSADFDNDTCGYTSGAIFTDPGDGVCTFRRAIVEAGARPDADRPIEIVFDIPKEDPNYIEALEAWEVQVDESWELQLDRENVFADGGQVTIDGATQPIGRTDGPRIMVNTNRDNIGTGGRSLEIYTSNNTIANIGFHGGGEIVLYEGGNVVENIWMGLANDGLSVQLASDANSQAERGLARGGITLPNEDSDGNKIINNVIIGTLDRAIRIIGGGDDNLIAGNWIGMNAQGEVPGGGTVDCTRELDYDPSRWYGGQGVLVLGTGNSIESNYLAALHVPQAEAVTPPIAFEIDGVSNTVTNNVVGEPIGGGARGVCGQGVLLAGHASTVTGNEFTFARNGFDPNDVGSQLDATIITQSFSSAVPAPWLEVHSNEINGLDEVDANFFAYRFAAGVPTAMRQFNPGKITEINGVTVSGTNGDDSITGVSGFCPGCTIFLYLDDLDDRVEALELMATTVADIDGNWTATLSRPLVDGESLRTQSMANTSGVMHTFGAGTTSRLSDDIVGTDKFTLLDEPCVVYRSIGAFAGLDGQIEGDETRTVDVAGFLPSPQNPSSSNCIPDDATAAMVTIQAISPSRGGNLRLSEAGVIPTGGVVNFADNGLDNANTVSVPLSSSGQVDITGNGGPTGSGQDLAHIQLMVLGYYSPQGALRFTPLTPCAVADTRATKGAGGPFVGPFGTTSSFPLIDVVGTFPAQQGGGNTDCAVPSWAEGVLVNVVATNPAGASGALEVAATGTDPNRESTPFAPIGMNNAAATAVPLNGGETIEIDITASVGGLTNVRVVVLGYFEDPATSQGYSSAVDYTAVNPCAAFDTRANQGGSGILQTAGSTTTYSIADGGHFGGGGGPGCGVPEGASAVLINLVAINPVGAGNLQAFATGSTPTGGVLNFAALSPSMNNANAVPIPLSAAGSIDVFVNGGPVPDGTPLTHVRGVVLGYFD